MFQIRRNVNLLVIILIMSCSSDKQDELNSIEIDYLKKRKIFTANFCHIYGLPIEKGRHREFGMTQKVLRNESLFKGTFYVGDSSMYKHIFHLSFPEQGDTSSLKNFYATFNLLVDCFNHDSLYLGSITVNDQCKAFNTNGRFDKKLLDEIRAYFPEWSSSYERVCK